MTLQELKDKIGKMSFEPPRAGKQKEAVNLILAYAAGQGGWGLALQWLLSYVGDAGLTQVGIRIVRQPEPKEEPAEMAKAG